jgi:DNA-binding PadR family transcriptional regulator
LHLVSTTFRRSPLALAVLGLLEDGPLHPYGIQQLIRQWGKDQVVNVEQRATLYKMINRLADAGLIRVRETSRDNQYPERTSYELTDAGRAASAQWLAEILSTPRNEFPEFPAALSFLPMITPAAARDLLSRRRDQLLRRLEERDALIPREPALPRVTLLETEYLRAQTEAEVAWLDGVLAALADGSLSWSREELRAVAAQWPAD